MAKGAAEYIKYYKENEDERKLHKTLSKADFVEHIKELGYEFTDEEFVKAYDDTRGKLTDSELDFISGGGCCE